MCQGEYNIFKIPKSKIKKQYIFFILAAIILVLIFSSGIFKKQEKPENQCLLFPWL